METNQANVTSDITVEHKFSSASGLHINVEDINVVGDVVTITATDHQLIDGTYVILSGVSAPNEINNNRYIVDEFHHHQSKSMFISSSKLLVYFLKLLRNI